MTENGLTPAPLIHDLLCIGCGYNLRGLEPSGRCPECGLAVADSNRGDRLEFADPGWLNKLRFGASLKLWNILIIVLLAFAGGIFSAAMSGAAMLLPLVAITGSLLGLWATFCITTQEPRTALTEDPVTLRKVIRACALITIVGSLIQHFAGSAMTPGALPTGAGAIAFWVVISLISTVAGLVVMMGELKYFRRFALRAPDLKLGRSTRIVMWGYAVAMGVTSIGGVVALLFVVPAMGAWAATATTTGTGTTSGLGYTTTVTTTTGGAVTSPVTGGGMTAPVAAPAMPMPGVTTAFFGVGACIFGLCVLIFGIWYILLLSRYRKLFQAALSRAQAAATPGSI